MDQLLAWQRQLSEFELPQVQAVQKWIDDQELGERLQTLSQIGDPALLFTLYFPIIAAMSWDSGCRILLTGILCEWSNQLLKWLFRGDRPYWFLHEVKNVNPTMFKQNALTCEAGPGLPSGHVMMNLAIWMILADTLTTQVLEKKFVENSAWRIMGNRIVWNWFLAMQIVISASRVYNLNHFPHQCLAGLVVGMIVIKIAYARKDWLDTNSKFKPTILALFLLLSSLATSNFLLTIFNQDPDWSVHKAMRFCQQRKWVHVESVPFFLTMRFSGAAIGLAMAMKQSGNKLRHVQLQTAEQIVRLILGLLSGLLCMIVHKVLPQTNLNFYYISEFVLHLLSAFSILVLVPWASLNVLSIEPKETKKKRKEKRH